MRHVRLLACAVVLASAFGCSAGASDDSAEQGDEALNDDNIDARMRSLIAANHLTGRIGETVATPDPQLVTLGRTLFYDKILGGDQNQACASCHHPQTATGDGLRLGRGIGSSGVGTARLDGPGPIIPRNAPPVWNAILFKQQFWDGRVSKDADGVHSPDGMDGVASSALAAQAKFPVTSHDEMRGALLPGGSNQEVRDALAARVTAIPAYVRMFEAAFGDGTVTYDRIAESIAAYETSLMPLDTPWFRYVRGDASAIDARAKRGARLFYEKARCATCHSGDLGTDEGFHDICVPQFGPGKGNGADGHDDFGRMNVTHDPADKYKFKTPTMVNVALHAPYGHDGAYATLEAMVRHHLDPATALSHYDGDKGTLEPALASTVRDPSVLLGNVDPALAQVPKLNDNEIGDLLAFLQAQTDPNAKSTAMATVPAHVPSGLPVDR